MKTFNKEDLITWSNRHKVKVGDEGYFANNITDLNKKIKAGRVYELMSISDNYNWCFTDGTFRYGFFLPKDAVKKEKTYRACRNVKELYELVSNLKSKMSEEECVHELLGTTIHFKDKYQNEFYVLITQIRIIDDECLIGLSGSMFSFNELFNNYEIEINSEWKPFGVLEK